MAPYRWDNRAAGDARFYGIRAVDGIHCGHDGRAGRRNAKQKKVSPSGINMLQGKQFREVIENQILFRRNGKTIKQQPYNPRGEGIIDLSSDGDGFVIDEIVMMKGDEILLSSPVDIRMLESQKVEVRFRYIDEAGNLVTA